MTNEASVSRTNYREQMKAERRETTMKRFCTGRFKLTTPNVVSVYVPHICFLIFGTRGVTIQIIDRCPCQPVHGIWVKSTRHLFSICWFFCSCGIFGFGGIPDYQRKKHSLVNGFTGTHVRAKWCGHQDLCTVKVCKMPRLALQLLRFSILST